MISTHLCQLLGLRRAGGPRALDARRCGTPSRRCSRRCGRSTRTAWCSGSSRATATRTTSTRLRRRDVRRARGVRRQRRWHGVPFYLRTGKAMADTAGRSRCVQHPAHRAVRRHRARAQRAGPRADRRAAGHRRPAGQATGPDMELVRGAAAAGLRRGRPDDEPLEAYERLLLDVLRGDQTLFTRVRRGRPAVAGLRAGARRPARGAALRTGLVGPDDALDLPGPARLAAARCLSDPVRADRRPRPDRRPAHLRAGGHRRHRRLVLRAAVRLAERVRVAARPRARRGLAARGRPARSARTHQFYFPDSNILVTRFLTDDGVVEVHDFMPVLRAHDPEHRQRLVRRVTGVRGDDAGRACASPPGPTTARRPGARRGRRRGVLITGEGLRLGLIASTDLTSRSADGRRHRRGRARRRARPRCSSSRCSTTTSEPSCRGVDDDRRRCSTPRRRSGARWLRPVDVHRPLAGDGQPLRADPQAAHPRADRRDHRRADDQPARADRRRAQLGLPLRLDPRRRLQPLRPAAARLHRRGRARSCAGSPSASARTAATNDGPRPAARALRHRRQRPRRGARARPPRAATATRGRCGSATPPSTSCSSTSTAS